MKTRLEVGASPNIREDIQVIRAGAIFLVVAYHTGLIQGGYIGVDVFFVVSGYVIMKSQLRRREIGEEFQFLQFLYRRGLRLIPALAVMLCATQLMALVALSPFGEIQDLVHQSWAAIGSVANAWYFADSGYFEASTQARPLLHTWSLSIEEQFYLGFAVVLAIATYIKKKLPKSELQRRSLALAVVLLVAAFVFSFVGSVLLSQGVRLTPLPFRFAYLGTPVRAWEFLVGIFTALLPTRMVFSKYLYRIVVGSMISILALIAVTYSQYSTFPGVQALPIVLATSIALLAGSENSATRSRSFLVRSLSWLGDRSYSLYLWHYPFLTFANLFDLVSPTWNVIKTTIAVALSLAVSDFSYRYLERPLQRSAARTRSGAMTLAGFMAAVFVIGGFVLVLANTGLGISRKSAFSETTTLDASRCVISGDIRNLLDRCDPNLGNDNLVLLVGDSHAAAIYDGILSATRSHQMSLTLISNPGCPFLADPPMGADSCRNLQIETREVIRSLSPKVLILASAGVRYLGADNRIPKEDGSLPRLMNDRVNAYVQSFDLNLESLKLQNTVTVVVVEAPAVVINKRKSLIKPSETWKDGQLDSQVLREKLRQQVIEAVRGKENTIVLDTTDLFCELGRCPVFKNGVRRYDDSTHLSSAGSKVLEEAISEVIESLKRD